VTKITDFTVVDEDGASVPGDPHGNNLALHCMECGAPLLAVLREHQRGSSTDNPAVCRRCHAKHWVEINERESRLIVHRFESKE
jgi:hypothetical protein